MTVGWKSFIIGSGGIKITKSIYIYKHEDEELDPLYQAGGELAISEEEIKVYQEAQRDFLVYQNLLKEIGQSPSIIIVNSLDSISNGKEFYTAALQRILSTKLILLILDYPVMFRKIDLETNHLFLQLLLEVYSKPKAKLVDLRAENSKRLGRRKISYPEKWPVLYEKWSAGEITGREFMKAVNLKRGTFYHMVAEYKEYLKDNAEKREKHTS